MRPPLWRTVRYARWWREQFLIGWRAGCAVLKQMETPK
jgi:hypothetical protein